MLDRRTFIARAAVLSGAFATLTTARAFAQADATPPAATPIVPVDIATLPLKKEGQLTIHADQPLFPPWFIDNDPSNGKGFEGALSVALAERLGFKPEQVVWGYTSFNASYAPGPKDFDFYITEVSITEARKKAVDFSDPYYKSPLTIVAREGTEVTNAKSLTDLKKFKFGAQVGTTYYSYIADIIKPDKDPLVFDTNSDSLASLTNGTVDAVIEDLETANFVTTIEFEGLVIVGVLPGNPGDGAGLVFEKGSTLVPYLNSALASLIADGTRDKLVKEWLPQPGDLFQIAES